MGNMVSRRAFLEATSAAALVAKTAGAKELRTVGVQLYTVRSVLPKKPEETLRAIEKIGLPAVRQHRLAEFAREEAEWKREFAWKCDLQPEIIPRLVLRVEGIGSDG